MGPFSNYKFRCSSYGALMSDSKEGITEKQLETIKLYKHKAKLTENQAKKFNRLLAKRDNPFGKLGSTCIDKLIEIYISETYDRSREIHSKYLEKGLHAEEDSLTLYSLVKGAYYCKNTKRLYNEYSTGLPDTYEGTSVDSAEVVIDTKTCWDIHTFYAAKAKPTNTDYKYQLQGYCPLTGAKIGKLAYCLVNTPAHLIKQEKMKVYYAMGCPDDTDPTYKDSCIKIEKNMIFDMAQFRHDNPGFDIDCVDWNHDIPMYKRVHESVVQRDEEEIQNMSDRSKLCRLWLNEFAYKEAKILQVA